MPFELHTWGPAFSLPSLDPDCLAVIAYLRLTLPPDTWVLIPTSDASISPTRDLPALRDGDVVVGGFQNIVNYLARISNGQWDLDSPSHFPSPLSRADIVAFQSHIPSHAHPLLSLLLYLSPQNYSHVTRPAYTPLLPWPAQYIIPPQRRNAAHIRCEHLGVQGVDYDDDEKGDTDGRRPRGVGGGGGGGGGFGGGMLSDALRGGGSAATGTTGQKSRAPVTAAVQRHVSGSRSKVSALIDALCKPLTTLLSTTNKNNNNNNKPYLLNPGTHPSTADCLALGYLSLLLVPSHLPISWMQESIRQRYPPLSSFVERGVSDIYGGETNVEEALEGRRMRGEEGLPWQKPGLVGAKMAERMIWGTVIDHLPLFGSGILHGSESKEEDGKRGEEVVLRRSEGFVLPAVVAVTTAVVAVAGYFYYATMDKKIEKEKRLSDMGEAGALFAGLDFGGAMSEGEARARVAPVGLEVDVSGDGEG